MNYGFQIYLLLLLLTLSANAIATSQWEVTNLFI